MISGFPHTSFRLSLGHGAKVCVSSPQYKPWSFTASDQLYGFATEDGSNRYDGYNFRVYKHDPFDFASLSHSWVRTS